MSGHEAKPDTDEIPADIAERVRAIYDVLEPLSPEMRRRVIEAASILAGPLPRRRPR